MWSTPAGGGVFDGLSYISGFGFGEHQCFTAGYAYIFDGHQKTNYVYSVLQVHKMQTQHQHNIFYRLYMQRRRH